VNSICRKNVKLLQLIQALAQLRIAEPQGLLPVGNIMDRLKHVSR
jgi:hypothetical protein